MLARAPQSFSNLTINVRPIKLGNKGRRYTQPMSIFAIFATKWQPNHMFTFARFLLPATVWLACCPASVAAPDQPASTLARPSLGPDSDGIVTNQAITVAGYEFFNYFMAAWRDKPDSDRYTLAIRERPSARLGSQVRIEFARRPIYQTRLPPSRAALKSLGEEAAEATYQAVLADAQRVLVDDVDLARDEF